MTTLISNSDSKKDINLLIEIAAKIGIELKVAAAPKADTHKKKDKYDPEFVAMVKKASESKNRTVIDPSNVWESL